MLSYRHAYHAGNHADVWKHLCLLACLQRLTLKPKAIHYCDTHSGAGAYSVSISPDGQPRGATVQESLAGIHRVWEHRQQTLSPLLKEYLSSIAACNSGSVLQRYPGSPLLAGVNLREQDRLWLWELHPSEWRPLRNAMRDFAARVHLHEADGLQGLRAVLPPTSRRGLTLIDPAYELSREPEQVLATLSDALKRFATGVYLIWFPIIERARVTAWLERARKAVPQDRALHWAEACAEPDRLGRGMTGSGVLMVNVPYGVTESLAQSAQVLQQIGVLHSSDIREL